MTYAKPQQRRKGGIQVGSAAKHDIILAQASDDASRILLAAAKRPQGQRLRLIRERMRYYGPGSQQLFEQERQTLLRRGWEPNQATYDAMRLVASNAYAREGMQAIQAALAEKVSGEYAEGLGEISDKGRQIGCGITGGVTAIGGLVASIYGGQAGGTAVGTGGGALATSLDCNKAQREAAAALAEQQAATAQANADAALAAAQAASKTAEERTKQVKTIAIASAGLIALLATGYAIVKV